MVLNIKLFFIQKAKRNKLLRKIFKIYVLRKDYLKIRRKILNSHSNDWYLVLTPEHGNLGDHAIAKAEINLLKKCRIAYTEITGQELLILYRANKMHLLDGKPIMINGGGNLGTLWIEVEEIIRSIIINNPNSNIIIMPSTIYYDDEKKLHDSAKIYNSHKKLQIYARESISYEIMKEVYNHVSLVPDMVLSLDVPKNEVYDRQECLLCFRKDCERTLSDTDTQKIKDILNVFFEEIKETDTVLEFDINPSEREKKLEEKFAEFKKAKLVVTDRLHGMIFSVITGTPCIVVNSKSHKLKGCYKWIKDLEYIFFLDESDSFQDGFEKAINSCLQLNDCKYDNNFIMSYFEKLKKEIVRIREE